MPFRLLFDIDPASPVILGSVMQRSNAPESSLFLFKASLDTLLELPARSFPRAHCRRGHLIRGSAIDRIVGGGLTRFEVVFEIVWILPVLQPGDIVVLDNLGSHRSKAVRQLIRSVGAKLYSPDLNPIEQVFAKLKHLLRKAVARTVDAACAAIGHALDSFTPDECANYLKKSGYRT
jgi:transposase